MKDSPFLAYVYLVAIDEALNFCAEVALAREGCLQLQCFGGYEAFGVIEHKVLDAHRKIV